MNTQANVYSTAIHTTDVHAAEPTVQAVPSISKSAMFVELSFSVWTGKKLDKRATKETVDANGAATGTGSFHKKLLGDCASLEAVQKFAANARTQHYAATAPWSDLGQRLIPNAAFTEYHKWVTGMEQEFWVLVEAFLQEYTWAQSEAQAKLAGLYNPNEYPSVDTLRAKFKFRYSYSIIPDMGDFRLDINNEAQTYLKEQYANHYTQQLNNAMKDVWQRTYDTLTKMSERLDYPAHADKGAKKIFRDSMIDNVQDMMGLLIKFNITNDSRLDAMRVSLEDAMYGVSPDALREDDEFRLETKRKVDSVLSNMKW